MGASDGMRMIMQLICVALKIPGYTDVDSKMMFRMRTILVLVCLTVAACASVRFPDPHHHAVDVHAQPWSVAGAPDFELVQVNPPPTDRLHGVVTNQTATLQAYVIEKASISGAVREYIQIEEFDTGRVHEVRGIPLGYRPYSDLVWVGDRYLVFDRWPQPHYGWHYVVDVLKRELILARPFPDPFYLDQRKREIQEETK